jgi:hypothetical protein
MQDKIKKGAPFFMLELKDANDFIFPWKVVYADKDWRLYDLRTSLEPIP